MVVQFVDHLKEDYKWELMEVDFLVGLVEVKLKDLLEGYIRELMVVDFLAYLVGDYKLELME